MRVTFRYHKTGREKVVSERDADLLTRLNIGVVVTAGGNRPTYQTRDMQAAAPLPAAAQHVPSPDTPEDPAEEFDDITEARAESDTQEPAVAPRRRGRPPRVAE